MLDDEARRLILEEAFRRRSLAPPLSQGETQVLSACAGSDIVERMDELGENALTLGESERLTACIYDSNLEDKLDTIIDVEDVPGLSEHFRDEYNATTTDQMSCLQEHGWNIALTEPDDEGYVGWELSEGDLDDESFIEDANKCASRE